MNYMLRILSETSPLENIYRAYSLLEQPVSLVPSLSPSHTKHQTSNILRMINIDYKGKVVLITGMSVSCLRECSGGAK